MRRGTGSRLLHAFSIPLAGAVTALLWAGAPDATAQERAPLPHPVQRQLAQRAPSGVPAPVRVERASAAREIVEADVSSRAIAITSAFTGTEIVVFGSVLNSRQPSAEAGYYDVIVVLEGTPEPIIARRKSNVAGLWVNTDSFDFESAPTYYAIASTRPVEEIADEDFLASHAIGLDYVRLSPAARSVIRTAPDEVKGFKDAVVRIKEKDGLYLKADYAVIFIGKSLFRASISLPANVPVGPLTARVYLLREGELLSTFQQDVRLEREGFELWIYWFAMRYPALYGLVTVMVAIIAGLLASALFRRKASG